MKRGTIAAIACLMMLSGCGKPTDMYEKYKANMDYSLGEYTIEKKPEEPDDVYSTWYVSIRDRSGEEIKLNLSSEKIDGTKEEKEFADQYYYWDFFNNAMYAVLTHEMEREITANYFDIHGLSDSDDENIATAICSVCSVAVMANQKEIDYVKKLTSAKDGLKLSELDLKKAAEDESMILLLNVKLEEGVEAEPYIELLEKLESDLKASGKLPHSYTIKLTEKGSSKVYNRLVIAGREVTEDELKTAMDGKTAPQDIREYARRTIFGEAD